MGKKSSSKKSKARQDKKVTFKLPKPIKALIIISIAGFVIGLIVKAGLDESKASIYTVDGDVRHECGKLLTEYKDYCGDCGEPVTPDNCTFETEARKCSNCDKITEDYDEFCEDCGGRFESLEDSIDSNETLKDLIENEDGDSLLFWFFVLIIFIFIFIG